MATSTIKGKCLTSPPFPANSSLKQLLTTTSIYTALPRDSGTYVCSPANTQITQRCPAFTKVKTILAPLLAIANQFTSRVPIHSDLSGHSTS